MSTLSKAALLGASDLIERDVELPSIGGSVRVRSLPAAYSNQAMSQALEMVTGRRGEQTATINTEKLEALQVLHGLIDPRLDTLEEVRTFATNCGSAWRKVVEAIDEISGIDKETIDRTNAMFQAGGPQPADGGSAGVVPNGSRGDGSDLPVRTGA